MSALLPAAIYGLDVPAGDVAVAADPEFPAAFRITMAAIDPSAEPEFTGSAINSTTPRATLKLIRQPMGLEDDSDEDDDEDNLQALLNGASDDEDDDSESDEEMNGGPSDPSKIKKARKEATMKALKEAIEDSKDTEELANGVNGISKKGKGKAVALDGMDEDSSDDESMSEPDIEEFVLCTLDPSQHYQQPLDITIGEDEQVFFKVSGTHTIYLTGNYVVPVDDRPRGMGNGDYDDDDDSEDDPYGYDLTPDSDELDGESESDELDDMEDPRITELSEEEDEAPKLIEGPANGKGKNKRAATDSDEGEPVSLDSAIAKSFKPEPTPNGDVKLTKKERKKLKNNAGQAVATATETAAKAVKKEESPAGKKVQFAKNLEQGPSAKSEPQKKSENDKKGDKKEDGNKDFESSKPTSGVKTVRGVKIDDKKFGEGPAARKGSKVSMRYIGKLADGKQFDFNKKGPPFTFKLGVGEVIRGWDIGIEGMTAGAERRIIVPPHLAYGSKPQPKIPANSELTFDVKCLEVK